MPARGCLPHTAHAGNWAGFSPLIRRSPGRSDAHTLFTKATNRPHHWAEPGTRHRRQIPSLHANAVSGSKEGHPRVALGFCAALSVDDGQGAVRPKRILIVPPVLAVGMELAQVHQLGQHFGGKALASAALVHDQG